MSGVIDGLKSYASGQEAIADNGYNVLVTAGQVSGQSHAQGGGN